MPESISEQVHYKEGYKYVLAEDFKFGTDLIGYEVITDYIDLQPNGVLTIRKGYAWDGASGPTIDTPSTYRGSLVHDALYQLMRMELLSLKFRGEVDDYLRFLCEEDGMWFLRVRTWDRLLGWFALRSATVEGERPIKSAP